MIQLFEVGLSNFRVSAAFTAMSAVVLNKLSKGLVYCIRRYILISL